MEKVLTQACHPQVDYINAHGTSTPLGDEVEADAIEQVFQNKPFINATKSLIGHTLWAAAVIECITCIIQLKGGFLHANINLDNPINTRLNFVGKQAIRQNISQALSLSFGFGGINTAILIKNI
jgi:malonyl-ACP decarboxylase